MIARLAVIMANMLVLPLIFNKESPKWPLPQKLLVNQTLLS